MTCPTLRPSPAAGAAPRLLDALILVTTATGALAAGDGYILTG
ncbi:hypothetical protein AB0F15_37710 [Amycolatopsis sp. NPDC026612]